MAREKRILSKSEIYHIMLRGSGSLFLKNADFEYFIDLCARYFDGEYKLYTYLLLENRIHLIMKVPGGRAAEVLKPLCTSYARYFNRTYSQAGKLFYDRYKSEPLETADEVLNAVRYLHSPLFSSGRTALDEYKERGTVCGRTELYFDPEDRAGFTALCMEDYPRMSDAEVGRILKRLAVPKSRLAEAVGHRISKARLAAILGLTSEREKKSAPQPRKKEKNASPTEEPAESIKKPEQKKELSVWLL